MTRKEEIKQAANESLCGDKSYVSYYEEKGFIGGAEWSDENPNEKMIAKYLHEKKGYPIDMNGNLPSFDETMQDAEKYLKYNQDQFINKAIMWLNNNFMTHDEYGVISNSFETEEEMLDDFKNYIKGE